MMRLEGLITACAAGLLVATVGAAERDGLPRPWFRTGDAEPADNCRTSVQDVKAAAFDRDIVIACKATRSGFTSVMQTISAEDYRGKRVRLSAQLRGADVKGWAGLWMRIDGETGKSLAFDNMFERSLKGSFDWQTATVVLDVAADARAVAFGVLQNGDGVTSTGAIKLEVVGSDVQPTGRLETLPKAPGNLSLR